MQVPNKNYKDTTTRRLMVWGFLVVIWVAIYSVFGGFLQMMRGYQRLEDVERRLNELKDENSALRDKQKLVSTDDYKIRMAREKLRLQKEDEVVVILPDQESVIGLNNLEARKVEIWQKWLTLLDDR